jgi:hypothetical protein
MEQIMLDVTLMTLGLCAVVIATVLAVAFSHRKLTAQIEAGFNGVQTSFKIQSNGNGGSNALQPTVVPSRVETIGRVAP